MSGETESNVSAWTIDSLRYHLEQIAADLDKRYQQRFDAQEQAVAAAFVAQDELTTMLTKLLDERYVTQTKAVESAFEAQQTAMSAALASAERAVSTALMSAEKAVTKAELASDKRFEAINEFRGQLTDQAATFMTRSEADVRISSVAEKVESLQARMDKNEGRSSGISLSAGAVVGVLSGIVAIITIVVIIANLTQGVP